VHERNPDGTSSQSLMDVDKNIRQALEEHQIIAESGEIELFVVLDQREHVELWQFLAAIQKTQLHRKRRAFDSTAQ
jgi:hypothetical protein